MNQDKGTTETREEREMGRGTEDIKAIFNVKISEIL